MIVISTRIGYADNSSFEWERTWRFLSHFRWARHEPPILIEKTYGDEIKLIRKRGVFSPEDTEKENLVFQHFAYVYKSQLQFKESYYGYKGALADWTRLQNNSVFPAKLSDFFKWVNDETLVDTIASQNVNPIRAF